MHHAEVLIGHFREMVGNWPVASCYFALCRLHTPATPRPNTHSHTYEAPAALDPHQPYPTLLPPVPATVTVRDTFVVATDAVVHCGIWVKGTYNAVRK